MQNMQDSFADMYVVVIPSAKDAASESFGVGTHNRLCWSGQREAKVADCMCRMFRP